MKYQVFISSTYEDLKMERDQIIKTTLELGQIPVGMEMFNASDEKQWQLIKRQIDDSDYYVVIIAHRYGSVDENGISYTEKEYDYAISKNIPVLGFIIADDAPWPKNKIEDKNIEKLKRFKKKAQQKMIKYWNSVNELQIAYSIAISKAIEIFPRPGWVRQKLDMKPSIQNTVDKSSNSQIIQKKPTITEKVAVNTIESPNTQKLDSMTKKEFNDFLRSLFSRIDRLMEALPENRIEEFARSDSFLMYKSLFEYLNLI